ncbi:SAM-dependent methyltransferase [Lewinellaceae bacterium SD302]|nr:SAM-dependent methyltransferase [Lewinellaceae bacterium SD302]
MLSLSTFLQKWSASGAAESSNAQSFTNDLCDLIGVAKPDPTRPDDSQNTYVFEKSVVGRNGNVKKIDCYKRGHFILENKQGAGPATEEKALSSVGQARQRARKTGHGKRGTRSWDTAMEKARRQAENYARLLAGDEIAGGGRPPFIMVADVGHSIAVYADWSRAGGHYQPFPDPNNYRIHLADLEDEDIRERLRLIWTDPLSLDPARRSAKVTKKIADRLAKLAKSLEGKYDTETVAGFLMRCLFTMFAEDVGLLEDHSFTRLLEDCRRKPLAFLPKVTELWDKMNTGGYSLALDAQIRRFNGGLFADTTAVELNEDQIQLLVEAAESDWREVEPAIFGTLLERALDPRERHKLGAHYTPRAYVERLVQPTILEPLRKEWEAVQAAALSLVNDGKDDKAVAEVETFLQRLADLRVLDPACGSANFLYVTLELLKRLEGEVRNLLRDLGQGQISIGLTGATITPENMLGIELNPRAARIAELVLWIGYLQWHLRSTGDLSDIGDPVLRDYHNIENRDAVLTWTNKVAKLDDGGQPLTRWDGQTYKTHPVTGEPVPDEAAQVPIYELQGAKAAEWPEADFIVGNPPFIGTSRMREALGDGYTEAIRKAYKNVPASADFVMYWWDKAAELLRAGKTERFGFITTNSIKQTFNRRVIQHHMNQKKPLSLVFAIPDHPWVDSVDGAAVRIAMTVGEFDNAEGILQSIEEEKFLDDFATVKLKPIRGKISADLTIGANVAEAIKLKSNERMASMGLKLHGGGFIIDRNRALKFGLEVLPGLDDHIKLYFNGRDLTDRPRNVMVIDLLGLSSEEVANRYPEVYNHLLITVKPERDQNNRKQYRDFWWILGEPRATFRPALRSLKNYIVTPMTAKHRFFTMLDMSILPDQGLVMIASESYYITGILSSAIHVDWALANGAVLGPTPRYNASRCFETFPFPEATDPQKQKIRQLAERLDAHRKTQQAQHPKLTMTGMYNVLEKLRAEEPLNNKEKTIYDQGLVGILREIHDELDAAVAEAYGWPADLEEQEILQRLVDLNAERAAEEARGLVRWLRPEYQAPDEVRGVQSEMELDTAAAPVVVVAEAKKWPKTLAERATVLKDILLAADDPLPLDSIALAFKPKLTKKRREEAAGLLETLVVLGQAELDEKGYRIG